MKDRGCWELRRAGPARVRGGAVRFFGWGRERGRGQRSRGARLTRGVRRCIRCVGRAEAGGKGGRGWGVGTATALCIEYLSVRLTFTRAVIWGEDSRIGNPNEIVQMRRCPRTAIFRRSLAGWHCTRIENSESFFLFFFFSNERLGIYFIVEI